MTIQRMDHVGVVVDDLAAATAFFVELGLELEGEAAVEDVGWTASSGSTMSESTSQWCGLRTATAGLS
jgi:catechol 2,3-dioxygenase-like lactoylglutathione lyase family enzyme